ncbi:hypothetical protein CVIRNUC_005158 [Coccomyxa viridis]|uniref:Uncharacterized protein n=1 Tax=Coccomyxa viridis TaxID=1274662 RepID=A0AAV1I6L6_9CHLO|nr:hypothetical protein CVIRNUC_005158 [Coccomyxa viridis]
MPPAMSGSWTDRPPPSWKKSNSFRVNTDTDTDKWSSPSSPVEHLDNPASPGTASAFRPMSRQLPAPNSEEVSVASPTSQLAAQGDSRQASTPTTPRLPPPPAAITRADSSTASAPERQGSHRKTGSWGGGPSPTASGGRAHRRTRSIESLGGSMDASETFRAELERIGSLSSNQGSPSVQPAQPRERPSAALSPLQMPMQPLECPPSLSLSPPKAAQPLPQPVPQTAPRRPSVGSPLSPPARKTSDSIPSLKLAPVAGHKQVHVAGKGAVMEQELISWDEVKDEKDVYQAVRTADGRQALVRAGDKASQEEILYLEDPPQAAPDMSVAQGAHASALYYVPTAAGHGPMYAYPVQYPDGRIMYHILPQGVSPLSSPHAIPAPAQSVASPPYPCSPTTSSTPPGHQRRSSVGTLSPLQNASATAFGVAAYAPAFGSAGTGPSAPTIYANSSGPLSPQHSQLGSGVLQGSSPYAMSPTASGQIPAPAAFHPQSAHQHQASHNALLEQLAGMRLATAKDDPFGGSTVWAT